MKLVFWRGKVPNFGDELNLHMWQHVLPANFFDDHDNELFLGIGSILKPYPDRSVIKIIAGSGWAGYEAAPNVHDGSWCPLWVRGPRTAAQLGLDPALGIADAAVLIRKMPLPDPAPDVGAAFMPHVDSIDRGNWQAVCALAGITFIDPSWPVPKVLSLLRGARVLVTEAMHGAIVADILRTPWIAVTPFHTIHRAKWLDWSEALGIKLESHQIPGSTPKEVYTKLTGKPAQGKLSNALLGPGRLSAPFEQSQLRRATEALARLVEIVEPQLSRDDVIDRAINQCDALLHDFLKRRTADPKGYHHAYQTRAS